MSRYIVINPLEWGDRDGRRRQSDRHALHVDSGTAPWGVAVIHKQANHDRDEAS